MLMSKGGMRRKGEDPEEASERVDASDRRRRARLSVREEEPSPFASFAISS